MKDIPFDLYTVLESLQDGIYLTDRKGITLFINSSYKNITGIAPSDVIGKNVIALEKQGVFSPIAHPSVMKSGKPITVMQTSKAGRKVVVTCYPIRCSETGESLGALAMVRDYTILEQLKQEVEYQRTLIQQFREAEQLRGNQDLQIVAIDKQMKTVFELASRLAKVDTPVLILGETGVGKELVAKTLLLHSMRKNGPMLNLNCAAIPENLMESELFGYAAGAFTGAHVRGKAGVFELADHGTLFLDEIGELPLQMQAKLLRALETQEIMRVGGTGVIKVNVRIIAATHRDLDEMVKQGAFRRDLLYRLRVATIDIPPLRQRTSEIKPFVDYFLEKYNNKYRRNVILTPAAIEVLKLYKWPGNVRELENLLQSLIVAHPSDTIDSFDLPQFLSRRIYEDIAENTLETITTAGNVSMQNVLDEVEKKLIMYALNQYDYNINQVAQAFECDRTTIQRKLKKYEIASKKPKY